MVDILGLVPESICNEMQIIVPGFVPIEDVPEDLLIIKEENGIKWVSGLKINGLSIPIICTPNYGILYLWELIRDGDFFVVLPCVLSTRELPNQELITATQILFEKANQDYEGILVSINLANEIEAAWY